MATGSFFMGLSIPSVGSTLGPQYAQMVNKSLGIIDGHDHTEGKGTRIPSLGLNINRDLPFAGNNAVELRSARFKSQEAPLSLLTDNGSVYVSGRDLYFRDGVGNTIRMTIDGQISGASAGNITGLVAPAGAAFTGGNAGGGTVSWYQNSAWFAKQRFGAIEIRDSDNNNPTYGITIKSPAALAAAYGITLPAALPTVTSFVTMDSTGRLFTGLAQDNGINTANLADRAVTRAKLALVGQVYSVTSGEWGAAEGTTAGVVTTNNAGVAQVAVTVNATGSRPIMVRCDNDALGDIASFIVKGAAGLAVVRLEIAALWSMGGGGVADVANAGLGGLASTGGALQFNYPASILSGLFMPPAGAGAYTFKLTYQCSSPTHFLAQHLRLVAWEM